MIDLIKFLPIEYSKQSRDFQMLCRLYTILYNNTKMYIDNMNVWNPKIDNSLVPLKSRTVNFIPKHIWDLNELEMVVSCFKYLMRNKGTAATLKFCINILMKVRGITDPLIENAVLYKNGCIIIRMNSTSVSLGVIEDLVEYLIPAGCTYRIIRYSELDSGNKYATDILYDDLTDNSGWFVKKTKGEDPRWHDENILELWEYYNSLGHLRPEIEKQMTVGSDETDPSLGAHNINFGSIHDDKHPYEKPYDESDIIKTKPSNMQAKRRAKKNEKKKNSSTK